MTFADLSAAAAREVARTQRRLPPEIRELAARIPVLYEAWPSEDVLAEGFEPDILGLFSGTPHGGEWAVAQPMPPRIQLYLENLWDFAEEDPGVFREEVRLTYLHELGHFLGWDEGDLAARGLD